MHSAAPQSIVSCALNGTSAHTHYHTSVIGKILAHRMMQISQRRQPITHYQQATVASLTSDPPEKYVSIGELYAHSDYTRFTQGLLLALEADTANGFP